MKIKTRPPVSEKIDFTAEMQGLIDEAYILFNRAIGKSLNVCKPCCVSFEMEKELVETPVSRLSRSAIYDYLEAVHYDELNCEIRHFLPRILEFVVQWEDIRHSTEITLDKCGFERACWGSKDRDFMERFSAEFIKNVLKCSVVNSRISCVMDYILMFDRAGIETAHLFEIWKNTLTHESLEHLTAFFYLDIDEDGNYTNPFSANADFSHSVKSWISHPDTLKTFIDFIEKEYLENGDTDPKKVDYVGEVYERLLFLS